MTGRKERSNLNAGRHMYEERAGMRERARMTVLGGQAEAEDEKGGRG